MVGILLLAYLYSMLAQRQSGTDKRTEITRPTVTQALRTLAEFLNPQLAIVGVSAE
jgi:DNA-binding MarR family transcriptional regulator